MMDAGELPKIGYSVEMAANGGWVVFGKNMPHEVCRILGAFDDHHSLLRFLMREHDAHAANRPTPSE